jgi:acyl-CoA thioesterase-1
VADNIKLSRIVKIAIFWILSILFACQSEQQTPTSQQNPRPIPSAEPRGVIVAFGTSLTEGLGVDQHQSYPYLLEERLRQEGFDYRVINAGNSGETTSGALARTDWILQLQPDIVILETGANDGLRGIDTALIEDNLMRIVAKLKAAGCSVVLVAIPMVPNLGYAYTEAFNQLFINVADLNQITLVTNFLAGVGGNPALNQADGIHPNTQGYQVIVKNILPYVVRQIEQNQK